MSKDVVSQCVSVVEGLVDAIARCADCVDVFVDYFHLRHPYLSISVVLMKCNNSVKNCDKHLYNVVLELTTSIESLYSDSPDLEKDVAVLRIRCDDGWLEYGYGAQRSVAGVPYTAKGFQVVYGGKKAPTQLVDSGLIGRLAEAVSAVVRAARSVMESEGLL